MAIDKNFITLVFEYLFDATSVQFPPIISPDFTHKLTYRKYGRIFTYNWHPINEAVVEGLYVFKDSGKNFNAGDNLFKCKDNVFLSIKFVCDGSFDCLGNQSYDELGCSCSKPYNYSSKCKYITEGGQKKCSFYYYQIKINICELYPNLDAVSKKYDKVDLYIPPLIMNNKNDQLFDKSKISCKSYPEIFYNISYICEYKLSLFNNLIPCRAGDHLENCTHFECNMKYKCRGYYCSPWGYVCDGKWDCPHGLDENIPTNCQTGRHCINMFKCKNSLICVYINDICNNEIHCPLDDDEYFCDLKSVNCPPKCFCWSFAVKCIYCYGLFLDSNERLPYHVVHIEQSSQLFTIELIKYLTTFTLLTLNHILLENICTVLPSLQFSLLLDAGYNRITQINSNCFQEAQSLKIIKINNNMITQIENKAFFNLSDLLILDISNNILLIFTPAVIISCFKLEGIIFQNATIYVPEVYIFQNLGIRYFISSNYFHCCFMPSNTICTASLLTPWYFSCTNLLVNDIIRVYYVFMSLMILFFSSLSFTGQLLSIHYTKHNTVSTVVLTLNITDFFYSIYFFILWVADSHYQGRFSFHEREWKSSLVCFSALSICLMFSLFSTFLLTFLSFLRFWTVVNPISIKFEKTFFIKTLFFVILLLSVLATTVIACFIKMFHKEVPFKLCSPFLDPTGSVFTLKITTLVTVSAQFSSVFIIFIIYLFMIKYLKSYGNDLFENAHRKKSLAPLFIQIFVVTVSNIICWIPSGIIDLVALFLKKYPINLIIWSTIAITPINSVINPIVFIVANFRSHKRKRNDNFNCHSLKM